MTTPTPTVIIDRPISANRCGNIPSGVAGLSVIECGIGAVRQTVLNFDKFAVTTGNTTGASFGSAKIYSFPQGVINFLGCVAYFPEISWVGSSIADAGSGDYSIGTTATADATLSGTEVNILPSTAMLDPFVGGVGRSNARSHLTAATIIDGSTTALDAYLNVIIDDDDVSNGAADDDVLFTGQVIITWANLGLVPTS